ncbi:MAG: hypothetical protein ACYCT2_03750 [Thermoplasmataceae archaeon]
MDGKLIKFYFRTRLPGRTLIFSAIFYAVLLIPGILYFEITSPESRPSVFFYEIFIFLLLSLFLSVSTGSVSSMKSDRDFYFVLPARKGDLVTPIMLFKFYTTGTILFVLVFDLSAAYHGSGGSILLSLFAALAISVGSTSIGITMMAVNRLVRIAVSVLITLWAAVEILGSPYALITLATSGILYGVPLSAAYLAIPLIISSFISADLGIEKFSVERGYSRRETRRISSFDRLSPGQAILKFQTSFVSTTVRRRGSSGYAPSFRLRTRTAIIVTGAMAAIYFYVLYFYSSVASITSTFVVPYVTFYIVLIAISNIPNLLNGERMWMSFASMGGNDYFKDSILAKCMSAEILLAPFIVADVVLYFFGIPYVLSSALVLALMVPASMIITFYFFSERVASQDLQGGVISGSAAGRNFILLVPSAIFFVIAIASIFFQYVLAVSLIAMNLLALGIMLRGRRWNRITNYLSEHGFV